MAAMMTRAMTDNREESWVRGRRVVRSARLRILASVILLLAFSSFVALALDRQLLLARVDERVEDSLEQEVEEFRRLVDDGRNPETGEPFGTDVRAIFDVYLSRNVPGEGEDFFTFLRNRPYRSTATSSSEAELRQEVNRLASVTGARRGDVASGGITRRYLAVPVVIDGRRVGAFVVTVDVTGEREEVTDTIEIGAGVSLLVLFLAAGLAYAAAGRVLAPLRDVTETAESISETDLSRRIQVEGDDEIARLAGTFNAMLDRLEQAFATQKDFTSDAGHELRTPITIIRGHLELLGDDPQERQEVLELVTDELDRMARLVDDLLLLAKAQRPDFLQLEDIDLDVLTEELLAKAQALAPRDWRLDGLAPGRLRVDRQRITQAVMNLARNAAEHTSEGDRISIGSSLRYRHAQIWVTDTGPGVPHSDRERIFERFARAGDAKRSEGAGLGLAIVRAIAEAHGGKVSVRSSRDRGAIFTLDIPTEPRENPAA
jgi:two-component system, OmpR family, sensor kinase